MYPPIWRRNKDWLRNHVPVKKSIHRIIIKKIGIAISLFRGEKKKTMRHVRASSFTLKIRVTWVKNGNASIREKDAMRRYVDFDYGIFALGSFVNMVNICKRIYCSGIFIYLFLSLFLFLHWESICATNPNRQWLLYLFVWLAITCPLRCCELIYFILSFCHRLFCAVLYLRLDYLKVNKLLNKIV